MYYKIRKFLFILALLISLNSCVSYNFSKSVINLTDIYNEVICKLENTLFKMEDEYFVINTYGFIKHPITGDIVFRDYSFINSKYNSKIFSISDGEVIDAGHNLSWDSYIKIKYNELEIIYGNLVKIEVNKKDIVSMGDIIGYGGGNTVFGDGITLRVKYKDCFLDPSILLNYDNNISMLY